MDLLAGVTYPLRALALLRRTPRLWRYVLVPILVNVLVAAVLYLGLFGTLLQQLHARLAGSQFGPALVTVLGTLLGLLLAVAIGFVLVRFGVVLGAPWYGQLSEELEALLRGQIQRPQRLNVGLIFTEIGRALLFELKKLALTLLIWAGSLVLLLIPLAGELLYPFAGFLIGALISCLDFFDGPQERRRFSFRQKLATVRATLPASLSFGLVAFGLVSLPLVNLLAIPLCVAAGNLFVIERALPQATESAQRHDFPASDRAA